MRVMTAGYTYRPAREARRRTVHRERVLPVSTSIRWLILVLLLVLPWAWASYSLMKWRGASAALMKARREHERLLSEWNRLTAEDRVRKVVAPMGLFKPTEREILRLP
ncbi:hypothetical protein [Thermosulfurimonas sp. F29]|uniref:hypothetical protein n=1 Tax=Thermosulfurimonas sp. F29 TaxID=2867247 RepID=UPI001C82FB8D|nr:hypothetical protein [Thermosulfurimonas sp. F29]MBX6422082.1 hypothetical protein [Thermosulfurimonas sp. F29]